MPYTLKKNKFKYKNPDTGNYEGVDVVAERSFADYQSALENVGLQQQTVVRSEGTTQKNAVTAAGTAAVANFPATASACDTLAGDFAATYVPDQAYAVGDYCTYQYQLYQCKTAIAANTDHTFVTSHWNLITVTDTINDQVDDLKTQLDTISEPGKNMFDPKYLVSDAGWTESNGVYTGTCRSLHNAFFKDDKSYPISEFKPNTQYTLSLKAYTDQNQGSENNTGIIVRFYYTDDSYSNVALSNALATETLKTLVSDSGKTITRLVFGMANFADNIWHFSEIQLEEGSERTTYVAYGADDSAIDRVARADIETIKSTISGISGDVDTLENITKRIGTAFANIVPSYADGGYPKIDTTNTTFTLLANSVILDIRVSNSGYYRLSADLTVDYSTAPHSDLNAYVIYYDVTNNVLVAKSYSNGGVIIPDNLLLIAIYNATTNAVVSTTPIYIDGVLFGKVPTMELYKTGNNVIGKTMNGAVIPEIKAQFETIEEEYNETRESIENAYTDNRVSYLFITDIHVDYGVVQEEFLRNEMKIAADMANSSDIDFVVLGGDYIAGSGTKQTASKYLRLIADCFRDCRKPVITLRGNHDKNNVRNPVQAETEWITTNDFYTILNAPFRIKDFKYDENSTGTELYFYYDIPEKKTRVIAYDSLFTDYPTEKIKWLCEVALNKPDEGWRFVFLSHIPLNANYNISSQMISQYGNEIEAVINALNNRTTYTGTIGSYSANLDFTNYQSKVSVISTGHEHASLVKWDSNTDCFFTTTGVAFPESKSSAPAFQGGDTDDSGMVFGRGIMDISNPNKYMFDVFSVSFNDTTGKQTITRSLFGNGVDKTVTEP